MIVEYGFMYDRDTGAVYLREFEPETGKMLNLPLVVKDGRVYAEEESAEA